jgi:hypothetical protein
MAQKEIKEGLKLQFSKDLLRQIEVLVEHNLQISGEAMTYTTAGIDILDSLHYLDEDEIKKVISSPNILWTFCITKANKILSVVQPKMVVEFDLYPAGVLEPLGRDKDFYRKKIKNLSNALA